MRVRRLVTGARRRQAASGSASSIAEDVAAPRVSSCLVVALPALGRVANRCRAGGLLRQAHHVGTSASRAEGLGQRGSERLAGRGSQTTCRTSAWRGARGRGTVPGTSAWRAAAVYPGGTRYGCTAQARCPRSFGSAAQAQCQRSSGSPGVGLCVTIRVAEQLTTLDPLCQVKSPCPRHLPDRGRAGRVTPPAG